jgi:hypothetical protein
VSWGVAPDGVGDALHLHAVGAQAQEAAAALLGQPAQHVGQALLHVGGPARLGDPAAALGAGLGVDRRLKPR